MKFSLNGALTVGTLDGANVEIREAVGEENFFLFGLTADAVTAKLRGGYNPAQAVARDPELSAVIELILGGHFSVGEPGLFRPLIEGLLHDDPYLVLEDYTAYAACHRQVEAAWADPDGWARMAVRNIAMMGRFSSDRTIREYAEEVWGAVPCVVPPGQS
jgi:starch phosphorylase